MIIHQQGNSMGNFNYNAYIYNDTVWDSHFHGNYELVYTIEGITKLTVNEKAYEISEGTFFLISPYSIHSLVIDKDTKTWVGVFSKDFVSDFAKANKYIRYLQFKCEQKIESFLKQYLLFEGTPERYICIACLNAVCNECLKNALSDNSNADNAFIERVIQYISDNLTQDITLRSIAEELGYEYHYFSSLFHSCFSINFKSFINIFRFEYACHIIGDKSKSITAICFESGFDTVRNFNRVFKELSGCTPSEYRNKYPPA